MLPVYICTCVPATAICINIFYGNLLINRSESYLK
jgi:hypothetical protein